MLFDLIARRQFWGVGSNIKLKFYQITTYMLYIDHEQINYKILKRRLYSLFGNKINEVPDGRVE